MRPEYLVDNLSWQKVRPLRQELEKEPGKPSGPRRHL